MQRKRPHSGQPRRRQGGQTPSRRRCAASISEFCTPETEGANPFHLEKKIFTGLSWKLIGTLGTQPLDISALGTHAGTLSEGDDLFVRIRPENVVYYNNN